MKLFDTPGADVATITTDGATIKPFLNACGQVAGEVKLQVTADGLRVESTDPANVMMGKFDLAAEAFDTYELHQEQTVGLNIKQAKKLCRRARKSSSDELTLHVKENELTATVSRGYDAHDVVSQGTMDLIDPAAIREEAGLPDLDLAEFVVAADPLTDALSYGMGAADHVEFSLQAVNQHSHALYIGGENDSRTEQAAISDIEADRSEDSLFSADYMANILAGINEVGPESVEVSIASDFPIIFGMESDGLSATYFQAPRIKSE